MLGAVRVQIGMGNYLKIHQYISMYMIQSELIKALFKYNLLILPSTRTSRAFFILSIAALTSEDLNFSYFQRLCTQDKIISNQYFKLFFRLIPDTRFAVKQLTFRGLDKQYKYISKSFIRLAIHRTHIFSSKTNF